jgi:biotin carboxylase
MQPFGQVIPFLPYIHTPSTAALLWSTEKPLMRDRLYNYDKRLVPKYQYMEVQDLPKLQQLTKGFKFPVIVKPSGLSKALLVTRCDSPQELKDCLAHTFQIIRNVYAREQYPGQPSVLVEEMMQGDMYSTDAYVTHDGQISCLPLVKVTTAHSVGLPGFYGYERSLPTGLSKAETAAAFKASRAAIKALNLSATTAHIELFHTADGWKIVELAARIGGYRDALYREAYGIEHFYNDLAIRMGQAPKLPGKPIAHAAVLNIYADLEGYIEAIEGLDEARQLPSVVWLNSHAQANDIALFASNGGNPLVDGILSNKDPGQLQKDISKVRELIKIKIKASKAAAGQSDFLLPIPAGAHLSDRAKA